MAREKYEYVLTLNGYLEKINAIEKDKPYFRGQVCRATNGYELKPSIGRYAFLKEYDDYTFMKYEEEVLLIFENHLRGHSGYDAKKIRCSVLVCNESLHTLPTAQVCRESRCT